jgi:hypothetical protein
VAAKASEHGVRRAPVVGGVERVARNGRACARDRVPAHREANDVDPEPIELVEPRLERAGALREPGIVLDSGERPRRRVPGVREDEGCEEPHDEDDEPHRVSLCE